MFYRLQNTIRRFMYGRYGGDALGRFLLVVYLMLWLLGACFRGRLAEPILTTLATVLAVYSLFRMLSRDIPRREGENRRFLRWWYAAKDWLRLQKDRLRDIRTCRYRRCPHCRARLRLPIKRGRRTVTCARCGTAFKAFFL